MGMSRADAAAATKQTRTRSQRAQKRSRRTLEACLCIPAHVSGAAKNGLGRARSLGARCTSTKKKGRGRLSGCRMSFHTTGRTPRKKKQPRPKPRSRRGGDHERRDRGRHRECKRACAHQLTRLDQRRLAACFPGARWTMHRPPKKKRMPVQAQSTIPDSET